MSEIKRLGFFTRLLDDAVPAERYRLALEQIQVAELNGFDSAWVAQHHFSHDEGGLPSPLVFLAHVASRTSRIRLGTGIITLPLEAPIRVAEDAAVLDALSGGRLELGVGSGGTPSSFPPFGLDSAQRGPLHGANLAVLRRALSGEDLSAGNRLYPQGTGLVQRIWQATFSAEGGQRAGAAGDGLMLSRTQPRPKDRLGASLADLQQPIIDAYLEALPAGIQPRILASRTLFVADEHATALEWADLGLRRIAGHFQAAGHAPPGETLEELIRAFDTHVGDTSAVIDSLSQDPVLDRVTDISFQVHSVDPPHALILRSLELTAQVVAPALGWRSETALSPRIAAAS
ncbi:MAG TPA: putative FMN-dependent luciferase-like monooxygenase [Devosia sp.]|jgi:putative FMN-dependent luciferase-like monooxygenase|uniref:putative FMN-dependent luciferase-like monooxygenase n=1 Tax=Devosia sp. TaxID=1871048 RepID=UPI002F92CC8C